MHQEFRRLRLPGIPNDTADGQHRALSTIWSVQCLPSSGHVQQCRFSSIDAMAAGRLLHNKCLAATNDIATYFGVPCPKP